MGHATLEELESALPTIRLAPATVGRVELIVRRSTDGRREILDTGMLDVVEGLVGDSWGRNQDPRKPDVDAQLTLMNARVIAAVAGDADQWPLAGDQLFVDFDLSQTNAAPGTTFAVGAALIQVSAAPHTGCATFAARFGKAARAFVNSAAGRALNLRGINARVVRAGQVRRGDPIARSTGAER
jgi:MOSC domain-containing protein YiiM